MSDPNEIKEPSLAPVGVDALVRCMNRLRADIDEKWCEAKAQAGKYALEAMLENDPEVKARREIWARMENSLADGYSRAWKLVESVMLEEKRNLKS